MRDIEVAEKQYVTGEYSSAEEVFHNILRIVKSSAIVYFGSGYGRMKDVDRL